MLCVICQKIFTRSFGGIKDHHTTSSSLRNSARENCYICDQLWQTLLESRPEITGNLDVIKVDKLITEYSATPFSTYVLISLIDDPTTELQITLYNTSIQSQTFPVFILTPRSSTWMPDYIALTLIKLIQNCQGN
jgi:hypothetical protein